MNEVTWLDNYFGWLKQLLAKAKKLKDRTVIVLALAVYLGIMVFTGTGEGMVISMWGRLCYAVSSPLRLSLFLGGAAILVIVWYRLGRSPDEKA